MNTLADMRREDRNATNAVRYSGTTSSSRASLQLHDSRPLTMNQGQWHERLNQSPKVESQLQLQQALNCSPRVVAQTKLARSLSARTIQLQPGLKTNENRTGLPDQLKSGIENLSGMAMDDLHVYYNSPKPERIKALAYTQGTTIHVGPGQEKHLAHEAWHAVQQKQGRVQPTLQTKDVAINDDTSLEREADVMGERAARMPFAMQMKKAQPCKQEETQGGALTSEHAQSLPAHAAMPLGQISQGFGLTDHSNALTAGSGGGVLQANGLGKPPEPLEEQLTERLRTIASEELPDESVTRDHVLHLLMRFINSQRPPSLDTEMDVVKAAIFDVLTGKLFDFDELLPLVKTRAVQLALVSGFDFSDVEHMAESAINLATRDIRLGQAMAIQNPDLSEIMTRSPEETLHNTRAAREFLRTNQRTGFLREPTLREKKALTAALLKMRVVKRILSGGINDFGLAMRRTQESPAAQRWLTPEPSGDPLDRKTFKQVQKAMTQIVNMVETEILAHIPVPEVVVNPHPDKLEAIRNWKLSDLKGFRAHSFRGTRQIHIAPREAVKIIVHETGHQLEYFLPTRVWLDIQQLLRMRHRLAYEKSGSGNKLVSIYPYNPDSEVRKEPRYQAEMPATKGYSAKFYAGSGNTEVMSMSMEYFSNPESAGQLIKDDPLQAAIILRAIAPRDFAHTIPPELQQLLPQYSTTGEYEEENVGFEESETIIRGRSNMGRVNIIEDYIPGQTQVGSSTTTTQPTIPLLSSRTGSVGTSSGITGKDKMSMLAELDDGLEQIAVALSLSKQLHSSGSRKESPVNEEEEIRYRELQEDRDRTETDFLLEQGNALDPPTLEGDAFSAAIQHLVHIYFPRIRSSANRDRFNEVLGQRYNNPEFKSFLARHLEVDTPENRRKLYREERHRIRELYLQLNNTNKGQSLVIRTTDF